MSDGVEVMQRMTNLWAAGDQAGAMRCVSEKVVLCQPESLPWGGEYVGHDGMARMFELMYQDLDQDMGPVNLDGCGSTVYTRQDVTWRNRSTGKSVAVPRLEVVTIEDSVATRFDVYLKDVHALLSIL